VPRGVAARGRRVRPIAFRSSSQDLEPSARLHFAYDVTAMADPAQGRLGDVVHQRGIDELGRWERLCRRVATYSWHDTTPQRSTPRGEFSIRTGRIRRRRVEVGQRSRAPPNPNEREPMTDEFSLSFRAAADSERRAQGDRHHTRRTKRIVSRTTSGLRVYNIPITSAIPARMAARHADDPGTDLLRVPRRVIREPRARSRCAQRQAVRGQYRSVEVAATNDVNHG